MRQVRNIVVIATVAAGMAFLAGCKTTEKHDHPHGDHPSGDHPNGDHPSGDHPSGDHPNGDHPN